MPLRGRITTSFFSARSSRASRMGVRDSQQFADLGLVQFLTGLQVEAHDVLGTGVANTYCFRDWLFWRGAISNILSAFHLN